jgi:hypothetical protein
VELKDQLKPKSKKAKFQPLSRGASFDIKPLGHLTNLKLQIEIW